MVDYKSLYSLLQYGLASSWPHIFLMFILFFLVIIITVRAIWAIVEFNVNVSTHILLHFYPLWCLGLQRLQRFDFLLCSYKMLNQNCWCWINVDSMLIQAVYLMGPIPTGLSLKGTNFFSRSKIFSITAHLYSGRVFSVRGAKARWKVVSLGKNGGKILPVFSTYTLIFRTIKVIRVITVFIRLLDWVFLQTNPKGLDRSYKI